MIAQATKLERPRPCRASCPACWTLKPGLEDTARQLAVRGDIIRQSIHLKHSTERFDFCHRGLADNRVDVEPYSSMVGRAIEFLAGVQGDSRGWRPVGPMRSKEVSLAFVRGIWTNMRPLTCAGRPREAAAHRTVSLHE
jgi:hypothetical protein